MIKQITPTIKIKTSPLNWIVEEDGRINKYFNYLDDVSKYLNGKVSESKLAIILDDIRSSLNISNKESSSALFLTKIKLHPEFIKKMRGESLDNLKAGPIRSVKHSGLAGIRDGPSFH